jgi:hypothetical protein
MSAAALAHWCKGHKVPSLLGLPGENENLLHSAELFKAYFGAVALGLTTTEMDDWVKALLNDSEVDKVIEDAKKLVPDTLQSATSTSNSPTPPRKRRKTIEESRIDSSFDLNASFIPVPTPAIVNGLGASAILTKVSSSKPQQTLVLMGSGFLAHLNQVATTQRKALNWHMSSVGPPHQLEWFASVSSV